MKYLYLLLLLLPLCCTAQSDKTYYWIKLSNVLTINNNWQLDTELDNRRRIKPSEQSQLLARAIVLRKLANGLTVGQGLVYIADWSGSPSEPVPEWRPYQEMNYNHQVGRLDFGHRLRLEEQFTRETPEEELLPSYGLTLRTRYRLLLSYQLRYKNRDKGNWALQLREEIMLNINKTKHFEENRLYLGLLHQPLESLSVELGYMFQRMQNVASLEDNSVLRLTLKHYMEL